jgi:Bacterial Ig domain
MLSRLNPSAQHPFRHLALALFFLFLFAAGAAAAPGSGKKPPKGTSSKPVISIVAPSSGSTLSGPVNVSGSASDSGASLARVQVSVDGGPYQPASGTSSWSFPLDTTSYPNGTHTIAAQATDTSGSSAVATETVTVSNSSTTPPPPPPPPPDTTPPAVSISAPADGSTVSGTVSVSGSASDNVVVSTVQVSVDGTADGGAYHAAQGTGSWSYSLDTTALTNGSHTISARATDTSGNVSTTSESVTVQNSSAPPAGVIDQLVTPEGVTIQIYSGVTGWTAQQVYDLLKPNAYQLSLVGPHYTIKVQTQYASSTTTSVSGDATNGYSNYHATTYLSAQAGSNFMLIPDAIIAHEYGHAWSLYHLYMTEGGNWNSYLQARGILGDSRLDTSYMWNRNEMLAEDYRLLFGTLTAQSGMTQMNYQVPDARQVTGLKDFLASSW